MQARKEYYAEKKLVTCQIETLFQRPTSPRIMMEKTEICSGPTNADFFPKGSSSQFMKLLRCCCVLVTEFNLETISHGNLFQKTQRAEQT